MYVGSVLNGISSVCLLVMVFNHTFRHRLEQFLFNGDRNQKKGKRPRYEKLSEDDIDEQINEELERSREDLSNIQNDKALTYYFEKEDHES